MKGQKVVPWIVGAVVAVGLVYAFIWKPSELKPDWLQGEIDVTQVRVASKVAGRLDGIFFKEGSRIKAGDVVAQLHLPELEAKSLQAKAGVRSAKAQLEKADVGARKEDIKAAQQQWLAADAQAKLAATTLRRMQNLYNEGVIPKQRLDEVRATSESATAQARAAKQLWDISMHAVRKEDMVSIESAVVVAQEGQAEVMSLLDEMNIVSPIDGEVTRHIFQPGEVVAAGAPVVLITKVDEPWAVLNLREDWMYGMEIGTEFEGQITALDQKKVRFKVYYIAPMGDFATWRSTRDLGGFDLKTFEVKAYPVEPVPGLRAGMSVLVDKNELKNALKKSEQS